MQIMQISISSKSRYGMRFVLSLRQSCKQRKRGLLFFRKAILSPLPRSAVEGTWTPTQVHGHEPESCAYANSATTAYFVFVCWATSFVVSLFSLLLTWRYIYYHIGNDLSTLFSKKIKKLFVGAFLCLKAKKYSHKATNSLLCGSIRVFSFFCYNLLCQLQANCKTNN